MFFFIPSNDFFNHTLIRIPLLFSVQVAYCRSEDLRRWFVQQEVDLFRFRFLNERNNSVFGSEVISRFLHENHLHFTLMSDSERTNLLNHLIAGTATAGIDHNTTAFYKVSNPIYMNY